MTSRTLAGLALAAAALLTAACGGGSGSDPLTARVCKALGKVIEEAKGKTPDADMMQMWVVMGIASEAGDDLDKLGAYVSKSDAETESACPEARKTVLDLSGRASLAELIR